MRSSSIMARQGAANVVIQLTTLVSKSLLLFVLARYLPVAEVGVFGLLAVTLSLGVHLLGLDFYAYTTRELLAAEAGRWPVLLRDQLLFHLLTYPAALGVALLPFALGSLSWTLLALFLPLLVAEHLGQEIQRALVTLGRPVQGALVLFVRAGVWIWVAAAVLAGRPSTGLGFVLGCWLAGCAGGILLGALFLSDLDWRAVRRTPIDWGWVRQGLVVAAPFLLASLAFRALLAVDRYTLQFYRGEAAVGIYSFYANFRNAVLSFVEMGVLYVLRPAVIAAHQGGRLPEARGLLRRMGVAVLASTLVLSALAFVAVFPLLLFVGEPAYRGHLPTLALLLLSAVAAGLAEIPHTLLYASGRDRAIVLSTAATLVVAVPLHLVLVGARGIEGAALASTASFTMLALGKYALARRGA